jgi:hypothetical protein
LQDWKEFATFAPGFDRMAKFEDSTGIRPRTGGCFFYRLIINVRQMCVKFQNWYKKNFGNPFKYWDFRKLSEVPGGFQIYILFVVQNR